MALKLQQALGLSLDDYIAEKGIVTNGHPKQNASEESAGFFKRQLRSDQDEEDEEDLLLMEDAEELPLDDGDEDEMLGDTPPPLIPRQVKIGEDASSGESKTPDLVTEESNAEPEQPEAGETVERSFITVERKRGIGHMPSQQWRLKRENQTFKKPAGVPPLMSVRAEFDRNTDNLIASLGENAKFNNDESRNRIQNRLGKLGRQNHNNGRNNGDRNWNQNRNRGNFGPKPCVASFNPQRDRFQQQNRGQMNRGSGGPINDLRPFLTAPNPMATEGINTWQQNNSPFGARTEVASFVDMVARFNQQPSTQDREKFSSAIQNAWRNQMQQQLQPGLLGTGPNHPTEVAPFPASVLLNHISAVHQNFGPKYDMKIQKEIHEMQNKKLLYGSSGVVSTDGPGIEDERIKPVTTDLSMNMRFSSAIIEN